MLALKELIVDHGKLRALWDISLHVNKGERVGLLGANGAGKSTTMGAIVGLYPVAGGEISYQGRSISGSPYESVRSGIALVPEGRRLFPGMSVQENLKMGAFAAVSRNNLDALYEQVFSLFPILKEKRNQRAGELSGGQQQMVAIARALMSRPQLLLLDEPFIGVAPLLVEEIMSVLSQISRDGVTMLLVEQNIHRALDFVSRAYVIENGRCVLEGEREALLSDKSFAAKFLGLD